MDRSFCLFADAAAHALLNTQTPLLCLSSMERDRTNHRSKKEAHHLQSFWKLPPNIEQLHVEGRLSVSKLVRDARLA